MTDSFRLAREQLRDISNASDGTVLLSDEVDQSADTSVIKLSMRFDGLERTETGLRVRAREQFLICVPRTFPFDHPIVCTPHCRFADVNHVQWKNQLCLYASTADWQPEAGMYGFIKRLDSWIRDAALDNLDPADAPLHPPVAYRSADQLIVVRANTPVVNDSTWVGIAELQNQDLRKEIVAWRTFDQPCPQLFALAILLHQKFPFEYPSTVKALLNELQSNGIEYAPFIILLAELAQESGAESPLFVVLGTPMRRVNPGGPTQQHLAVWQISHEHADTLRAMLAARRHGSDKQAKTTIDNVIEWSESAEVGWCDVREMRPEVTNRRDQSSAMTWFRGKRVAIWGCGAVGTHVAESVVRAGVASIELTDNKWVTPGVLVRQNFEDTDIGKPKAHTLAGRLRRVAPDVETSVSTENLISRLTDNSLFSNVDLIIDCTASAQVRTACEYALNDIQSPPAIASIAIDSNAKCGLATLSMPQHSGGSLDLVRRLKLEACRKPNLAALLEAFWLDKGERFYPEPGCSEPTFIGSDADLAGLTARAINAVADAVSTLCDSHTSAGWLYEESGPTHAFKWTSDYTIKEAGQDLSIRVSSLAMREMLGWARRTARIHGEKVETGGLVFGELNEAARVLWVTEVEGPPPDSNGAEDHFTCGIQGMEECTNEKLKRFRGSVACIGSWHTHPTSSPRPSVVDINAVRQLVDDTESLRRNCLLLILSGNPDNPELGAYAFRKKTSDGEVTCLEQTAGSTLPIDTQQIHAHNIGLAFSGGGSRAIAFHLGCFRALKDLRLLDRVQVMSSVSGGSVIAAMYAYSKGSFQEFEERGTKLLRRGLQLDIFLQILRPGALWKVLCYTVASGVVFIGNMLKRLFHQIFHSRIPFQPFPPPKRRYSRSEALRSVLAKKYIGERFVQNVERNSLHTVINATELRTGTAFRFGSQESGCWRFGTIEQDVLVADAVAASAAYPVFLPALDRTFPFRERDGTEVLKRVLLTDGGVFENLGVGPMEPDRSSSISTNVFKPDYIISCDAGAGQFDDFKNPMHWPCRVKMSFEAIFRKVQDATRKRLHQYAEEGKISGFALSYLGQQDQALPWMPGNLPTREEVRSYPTDFKAMSPEDIDRLALRGELLTRFLIAYYLPDL